MKNAIQNRGLALVFFLVAAAVTIGQSVATVAMVISYPTITSISPTKNQNHVSVSSDISITFSEAMNEATLTTSTIRVTGSISGLHDGSISFSGGGTVATYNPTTDFSMGEVVTVIITNGAKNEANTPLLNSFSWKFNVKTSVNGDSYSSTNYTTGYGPRDVRIVDVDGDGDNDLVVMNYDAGSSFDDDNVSILKNNGNGTFAAQTTFSIGANALFLAIADVDNDNDMDIISANDWGFSLSVLKNNGSGSFGSRVDYTTPSFQLKSVASADVNGDGFVDLISPVESIDSVLVYMNNGDGTFTDYVKYLTGDGPIGITTADVDGDGDMDIITSNYASNNISVLMNNGDGTFATHIDYATGGSPRMLTHADVNGDGYVDMIVANINTGNVSVLINNGDGTFAAKVDYATAFGAFNPVAQDIDGDGDMDIINANAAPGNNFSVLKNNGDGTFAAKVDYLSSTNMYAVAAGDLDGNGTVDFVAGQAGTNLVTVMLNVIPPSITATTPALHDSKVSTSANIDITFNQSMLVDSLNGRTIRVNGSQSGLHSGSISLNNGTFTATFDPDVDFAVGEIVTVTVTTDVKNNQNATMTSPYVFQFTTHLKGDMLDDQSAIFSPGTKPYGVAFADFDKDGFLDMIFPNAENDSVTILVNGLDGEENRGDFSSQTHIYTGSSSMPTSVAVGDFNADGKMDFVVSNYNYNNMAVYINNGDLSFTGTTYDTESGPTSSAVADYNGDGYLDIAVVDRNALKVSVFINNGDGTFAAGISYGSLGMSLDKITAGDIDGDYDQDLVCYGSGGYVVPLKNDGNGNFTISATIAPMGVYDLLLSDLNGDNKVDLITTSTSQDKVITYLGNGDGTFAAGTNFTFNDPVSVTVMDLNNDNHPDIIVSWAYIDVDDGNSLWDKISYLRNNGDGTFSSNSNDEFDVIAGKDQWGNDNYSQYKQPILSTADLDGDGDLELVQTSRLGSYVVVKKSNDFVTVTSISPSYNASNVSPSTNLSVTFNYDMDEQTFNDTTVVVSGSFTGYMSGTISYNSGTKTVQFDPTSDFKNGETITLTITTGVASANGTSLYKGKSTEFTVATTTVGKGYFSTMSSVSLGLNNNSYKIVSGDLNGDGFADMATANFNNGSVYVVLTNGDTTYSAPVSYSGFGYLSDFTLADFDKDGDLDIVLIKSGNSQESLLLNDGSGTFTDFGSTFDSYQNSYNSSVIAKDVNNDGKKDLILNTGSFGSSSFYFQTGTWSFNGYYNFDNNYASKNAVVVDVDNDGYLDLIQTSKENLGMISLLKNKGDGMSFSDPITYPAGSGAEYITSADLNGDGYVDLVVANSNQKMFTVLLNNGDGTFAAPVSYPNDYNIVKILVGDVNGDGDNDLIFMNNPDDMENEDTNYFTVVYNNGSGSFYNSASFLIPGNHSLSDLTLGDINGDGSLDIMALVYAYNEGGSDYSIFLFQNMAAVAPTIESSNVSTSSNNGSRITINWTRGDGSRHLVIMKAESEVNAVPANNGNYSLNNNFGSGTDLGGGNYIVYNGGGSSVNVTGLSLNTQYHVAIYELNGDNGDESFYTANAAIGSFTTNVKDGYPFDTTPGKALSFNGESSIGEFSYEDELPKQLTFQMWVKVSDSSDVASFLVRGRSYGLSEDGGNRLILEKESKTRKHGKSEKVRKISKVTSNGEAYYNYPIQLGINNGHLFASIYDDDYGDPVNIVGTDTVKSNQWYHVALTMEQVYNSEEETNYANGTFYVNGNVVGTYDNLYYDDYTGSFLLGYDDDVYFHGELDELQIRDKILTTAEIRASMHTTLTGFPSNLLGYWQFNEGTGTTGSQLINSKKFYFENVDWVDSDAPIGEGTVSAANGFSTGTQSVGNATLTMADDFDNPVDITVTEVTADPNQFPEGYTASLGGKTFIIELFGDPGTFSANLSLNLGSGVITSEMENNPTLLELFKRPSTSTGTWTSMGGAVYANASTGEARWEGITSFSQFIVADQQTLPVELSSISYSNGYLKWETQSETNNVGWEIEGRVKETKSISNWTKFGFISGKGTTTEHQTYSFELPKADKPMQYRLKQLDQNGTVHYSKIIETAENAVPLEFALAQNYPNPFNPTTTIKFTLKHDGLTTLNVFNMLGQQVTQLLNKELKAGEVHTVQFNGQNLSSGIYFFRLESGNDIQIRKMTLVK